MTKEVFYQTINKGRYPKYVFSQIKEGKPTKECASIVCTASGRILLAKFECGIWQQAHFSSSCSGYPSQHIYYTNIEEEVIYWTDGKAEDKSREQFENSINERPFLASNLDEAAEEIVRDWLAYGNGEYKKLVIAGAEWMAGQGYSEVADVWSFGKNGIPAIFVDNAMYLPENEFKPGDKVIVQIRKKQ